MGGPRVCSKQPFVGRLTHGVCAHSPFVELLCLQESLAIAMRDARAAKKAKKEKVKKWMKIVTKNLVGQRIKVENVKQGTKASYLTLLPVELLELVEAASRSPGSPQKSYLAPVCRTLWSSLCRIVSLEDRKVQHLVLPVLCETWHAATFVLAAVGRRWLARMNAERCREREIVKARKKARERAWLCRRVVVWWDGDGVFYEGLVIRVNRLGTRVRVRFDEPVGSGPSHCHWVLPDELGYVH